MSDRAATTSYLARTSYAAPRLFHHLFQHHLTLRSVSFFCSMHPAVKFFQRFQAGLLADAISNLVWTLAGDQQCKSKLPEKCGPLCDVLVEEKENQISLIVARHESERVLFIGLIVASFLLGCGLGWALHCGCPRSRHAAGRVPDGADRVRRRGVVA